MEKRYTWNVNCGCTDQELTTGVFGYIINETVIDFIEDTVKTYEKQLDLASFKKAFDIALQANYDIGFVSVMAWAINKNQVYNHLLEMVNTLDLILSQNKLNKGGDLVLAAKAKIDEVSQKLVDTNITTTFVDFGDVELEDSILEELFYEVQKANEGQLLVNLSTQDTQFTPYDTKKFKNSIVDNKLKKMDNALQFVETALVDNKDKVNNEFDKMLNVFYTIIYSGDPDSEKEERVSKVIKRLLIHKQKMNELEDYLADAKELSRQLVQTGNKLVEELPGKLQDYDTKIAANPKDDKLTNERKSLEFSYENYVNQINRANARLQEVMLSINSRRDAIDNMMKELKGVVTSKGQIEDINKLTFEIQDFAVKIEMGNSQTTAKTSVFKDYMAAVKESVAVVSLYLKDFKELYLRNTMAEAMYKAFFAFNFAGYTDKNVRPVLSQETIDTINANKEENEILTNNFVGYANSIVKVASTSFKFVRQEMSLGLSEGTLFNIHQSLLKAIEFMQRDIDELDKNVTNHVDLFTKIMKA